MTSNRILRIRPLTWADPSAALLPHLTIAITPPVVTSAPEVSGSKPSADSSASNSEPRTLFVASTGGHLAELHRLWSRLDGISGRPLWVTFDSQQSRALLQGEEVVYVPTTGPRDYKNVLRNLLWSRRIMREHNVTQIVSTGSAIALSFFPLAWMKGASCHFIETAARRQGPSVTGRAMGALSGVRRYTQCKTWAGRRWLYRGSLFDGFVPAPAADAVVNRPIKVVVLLGTMKQSFEAALRPLADILGGDPKFDVRWQVGNTPTTDMGIFGHKLVPPGELQQWISEADLVIAHAGMGSTLDALEGGVRPLLIARRSDRGEHVDDHQSEIANELASRDLATVAEPHELTLGLIKNSVGRRIVRQESASQMRFELSTGGRRGLVGRRRASSTG